MRVGGGVVGLVASLGLLAGFVGQDVQAQPSGAPRAAAYAAWKAQHPDLEAEIADLKTKTRAMIEGYVPYVPPLTPEAQNRTRPLRLDQPAVIWRVAGGIKEIWDHVDAPVMVVTPAGEYTMGSPGDEAGRQETEDPRRRIRIGYAMAVSKYPVQVQEFAKFAAETGYVTAQCQTFVEDKWENLQSCNWSNPGFPQADNHPVVAVNWDDAQAYIAWLSGKTGHTYRLLSDSEYEYVNRAGTSTVYWWGDAAADVCAHANGADLDAKARPNFGGWSVSACRDGHVFSAPVGSFKPNPFGLYETTGNTWSWTQDCWNENSWGAPVDGSPRLTGICRQRVVRGGAWAETAASLRSAKRTWNYSNIRFAMNSFRVVRVL